MKRTVLFLFAFFVATAALSANDDEVKVSFSADAAIMNKYVWRGIPLTDGTVFQPSGTVAIGGFSFNVWANMDLDDVNDNEFDFNEVDFTGDYTFDVEAVSVSVGFINYQFPNTDFDSTTEIYAGLTFNSVLSPSVTLYRDIDLAESIYLNFGVSHDLPIEGSDLAVSLFGNLGWGDSSYTEFYFGVEESVFTDLIFGGSLSIPLGESLSITPSFAFSALIDDAVSDQFEDSSHAIFGVTASASF